MDPYSLHKILLRAHDVPDTVPEFGKQQHAVICHFDYLTHCLMFPHSAANNIFQVSLPTGSWLGFNQWEEISGEREESLNISF